MAIRRVSGQKNSDKKCPVIAIATMFVSVVLLCVFNCNRSIRLIIPVIADAAYLLIYNVSVLSIRYSRTGSLKKSDDGYELSFREMMKEKLP